MGPNSLPKMSNRRRFAIVVESKRDKHLIKTVVRLVAAPASPIAPASLIYDGEVILELHQLLGRRDKLYTFESYDVGFEPPMAGLECEFRPWWTPDQLAIAQDLSREWQKVTFVPSDAVEIVTDDSRIMLRELEEGEDPVHGRLVEGGWDHEHCALCWRTISAREEDDNTGYRNGRNWLCSFCYQRFIVKKFFRQLGNQGE